VASPQRLFDRLSDGGNVYMPLDDYGVTWQLNVP